jgi:hypothetical protein
MSNMTEGWALRAQFEWAVLRLAEILSLPKNEIIRDSAIQRFQLATACRRICEDFSSC